MDGGTSLQILWAKTCQGLVVKTNETHGKLVVWLGDDKNWPFLSLNQQPWPPTCGKKKCKSTKFYIRQHILPNRTGKRKYDYQWLPDWYRYNLCRLCMLGLLWCNYSQREIGISASHEFSPQPPRHQLTQKKSLSYPFMLYKTPPTRYGPWHGYSWAKQSFDFRAMWYFLRPGRQEIFDIYTFESIADACTLV